MFSEKDIQSAIQTLRLGGIILYPTDTIWGIGCDATNAKAVERIFALKKRSDTKSMIVLLANERDLLQWVSAPDMEVFNYLDCVSKPTTVIYEGVLGLAENLAGDKGTIAIRIVKEEFCRHLIKRFGKPIVSTSANISGQPSPANFAAIDPLIINGVDYCVEYRQDDIETKEASAVVYWNKDGTVTVLRP